MATRRTLLLGSAGCASISALIWWRIDAYQGLDLGEVVAVMTMALVCAAAAVVLLIVALVPATLTTNADSDMSRPQPPESRT